MNLRFLLLAVTVLLLTACSPGAAPLSQDSASNGTADTAFSGMPGPPAGDLSDITPRGTSEANNYICAALYCRGAADGLTATDGTLTLDAGGRPLTWAVYPWGGLGVDNIPTELRLSITSLTGTFWLGFSDYSQNAWSFNGPYDVDTVSVAIEGGSDLISADGSFFVAVVVPRNSVLELGWLNLVTSLDTGKIYVDASATGPGDGSAGDPFTTVEDGVAAADNGDTVVIAPGEYSPPDIIYISKDIRIEGAGACRTSVDQALLVADPPGTGPVVIEGLDCTSATFDPSCIADSELQVLNCSLRNCNVSWSDGHRLLIQGCLIDNGIPADPVIRLNHDGTGAVNTIRNCTINGGIQFSMADGASNRVLGNTITGLLNDNGGRCATLIEGNYFDGQGLTDASYSSEGVEDSIIRNNTFYHCGIYGASTSVSIVGNRLIGNDLSAEEVLADNPVFIDCSTGPPTNIVDNLILLPHIPFDGEFDGEGEFIAIDTMSGEGVVEGNTIIGGSIGIRSLSSATSISFNSFSDMHMALFCRSEADLIGNTVEGCAYDAFYLDAHEFAIADNSFSDIDGACIRIVHLSTTPQAPDLGGGPLGCAGRNLFLGYGDFAVIIESGLSDVPLIHARNNYWGDGIDSEAAIAAVVWDGADDPLLSVVDYVPFLTDLP